MVESNEAVYINTMDESLHNYENLANSLSEYQPDDEHNYENYENFRTKTQQNPYEDDVQTVYSEGIRSEYDHAPPIPDRPTANSEDEEVILGLGELSEADERVQRFYGILPKEKPAVEIKTVRMVKRDNKERSTSAIGRARRGEDDTESIELSQDEDPPPPLPRGNYTVHSFLSNQPYADNSKYDADNTTSNGNLPRPQFKLGEYYRRAESAASNSRPGSSMSAHERLFGCSVGAESLSSVDNSPTKSASLASDSSAASALMSPVFKSAAARAIIEEERKTPMIIPKARKKNRKQRHMTITSSHPAVLEAINRHEATLQAGGQRSRDDMDLERMLKPRVDAPDVVRSTYVQENDIDNLFGVPNKISIPERYVPEQVRIAYIREPSKTFFF